MEEEDDVTKDERDEDEDEDDDEHLSNDTSSMMVARSEGANRNDVRNRVQQQPQDQAHQQQSAVQQEAPDFAWPQSPRQLYPNATSSAAPFGQQNSGQQGAAGSGMLPLSDLRGKGRRNNRNDGGDGRTGGGNGPNAKKGRKNNRGSNSNNSNGNPNLQEAARWQAVLGAYPVVSPGEIN